MSDALSTLAGWPDSLGNYLGTVLVVVVQRAQELASAEGSGSRFNSRTTFSRGCSPDYCS
jgi:hypothetical protein